MESAPTRDPDLLAAVTRELRHLRASKGDFKTAKLSLAPALHGLALQPSVNDTWRWILSQTDTLKRANRYADVAFLSIFGPGHDVLARLTNAGERYDRDQRTAREWSDRGIPLLAGALVDATYLHGNRAMHFVEFVWLRPPPDSTAVHHVGITWYGDELLRHETIQVGIDASDDAFEWSTHAAQELGLIWEQLDPPRGAIRLKASCEFAIPDPREFAYKPITFRVGRQFTQMVNIANLPRTYQYAVSATTFRQGVTFWFNRSFIDDPASTLPAAPLNLPSSRVER